MQKWALLIAAIVIEVAATLSLRASQDHSAWLVLVVGGYFGALVLLTMVLRAGMPVGVAYGVWGAIVFGIGLIIAGVLLVEFGSQQAANEPAP